MSEDGPGEMRGRDGDPELAHASRPTPALLCKDSVPTDIHRDAVCDARSEKLSKAC